jgi:hypothetical protein
MYYIESGHEDPNKLYQGDIFEPIPCPFLQQVSPIILRQEGDELVPQREENLADAWSGDELILVRARKCKAILLSQTCDIHEERKQDLYLQDGEHYDFPFILYAPLIPMNQLQEYPRLARNQENVRRQNLAGAFWLPNDSQRGIEESVVFFPLVCCIQKRRNNRFETFSPKRRLASLKSPFREALASKFSHWISRVALPSGLVFRDNRPSSTRT